MSKKQTKEYRIENILLAAIDEFTQKGYDGASIDAIATKAGVSKGGFYYHFANKEILLMEANNKLSEPITKMAEKALSNTNSARGLKQYIIEYMTYWLNKPKELSFLFLSMSKALASPTLTNYYRQYVDNGAEFFTCMFKKIHEAGEIDIQNPELYGISLMGSLDGIISYAIVHPNIDIEALADQLELIWLKN